MFSNVCPRPSALIYTEIPMIFCWHMFWVVPECSAKFEPNFSRLALVLNQKYHIFAIFVKFILCIPAKFGTDIARGKGHLVWESDIK